jgi:hypothetical protein
MNKLKVLVILILIGITYTIYQKISKWVISERKTYREKKKVTISNRTIEQENSIKYVGVIDNSIKNTIIYAFQTFVTLMLVAFVLFT